MTQTEDIRIYQALVLEADAERVDQAYWLAHCELGLEPPPERWGDHLKYIARLKRLAAVKLKRVN